MTHRLFKRYFLRSRVAPLLSAAWLVTMLLTALQLCCFDFINSAQAAAVTAQSMEHHTQSQHRVPLCDGEQAQASVSTPDATVVVPAALPELLAFVPSDSFAMQSDGRDVLTERVYRRPPSGPPLYLRASRLLI